MATGKELEETYKYISIHCFRFFSEGNHFGDQLGTVWDSSPSIQTPRHSSVVVPAGPVHDPDGRTWQWLPGADFCRHNTASVEVSKGSLRNRQCAVRLVFSKHSP